MVNSAIINWYSKKQNTIETSTYGSEFLALKTAQEMIDGLIFKLQMLGVPISGPARVFCDSESVVKSSTFPESVLKKKHCAIAYHKVREAVAMKKNVLYIMKDQLQIWQIYLQRYWQQMIEKN